MFRYLCVTLIVLTGAVSTFPAWPDSAAPPPLSILPEAIALNRAGAQQAILVEQTDGARWTADLTVKAAFQSSDPAVAEVDAKGVIHAVRDGEAVVSATVNGQTATAKVTVTGTGRPREISFRNDVQPVLFKMGCNTGACHGAAAGKNGFKLSLRGFDMAWDHMALTHQANARRVSLAEPEQSLILLKPTMQTPHAGGVRFEKDSEQYRRLMDWIRSGAPGARDEDPRVDHLEAYPKATTLKIGDTQRVIVNAIYTDGSASDATRWVKFGATDENVATVDDDGVVTIKGPGAVAITLWYASRVSSTRITVPRATPVPHEVYATAPRSNYIDDLILQQLESLQIAPAGAATDTEFIRRAFLDTIGLLPTPAEVFRFVMDPSPTKRGALIDALLARPEYVDYWSYKWADLLLLSSKNLPKRDELTSFYRFIRASVERNQPWDTFATDILTAKGSTLENGAANYFAMHKETIDLTETTSQAFLGMSITCARCHNHPLEKWTQDDYYGMANLLARVNMKNGRRGDDTEVLPALSGNILHPRLNAPVAPKPLDAPAIDINAPGDRREALAKWLTSPDNPYFTRAIVNRVWRNFMGRGLVEPEDDLRLTNPALNEDLFNALCADLAKHRYDLKYLIRAITATAAYQRSSQSSDPAAPDDKHYSQYIVRRLTAETLLDVYSQVTRIPTAFDGYPSGFRAMQLPDSQVASYFLTAFGRPQRIQTCSCERTKDSSVAQTLHVANGDTLNGKLRDPKSFITELVNSGCDNTTAVKEIYIRTLARYPSEAENAKAAAILGAAAKEDADAKTKRREALEDLAWAVLSGKEFMFNH